MSNNMTVAEIREVLDSFGIEYGSKMKKADLMELMEAETVAKEEVKEEPLKKKTYVVIRDFKDLQDKDTVYTKDDPFPRESNSDVSQERINELLSNKNKIGKQLIREQD